MTTALPQSATTPAPNANSAPGCKTCAGRPAARLYSVSTGDLRGLPKADAVVAEAGNGAHVHQSMSDDQYVVVRPVAESEAGQP